MRGHPRGTDRTSQTVTCCLCPTLSSLLTPASRTQILTYSFTRQIPLHLYSFHIASSQICSVLYIQLFPQNCAKQHCGLSYSSQSMHLSSLISLIISKYSCRQCQGLTEWCVFCLFVVLQRRVALL